MAENDFLDRLVAFLTAAGLLPAPGSIGCGTPTGAADLPAIVVSLDEVHRRGGGLAEGASAVEGALPLSASIDLADPVLPAEPGFRLLSDDRISLILPHGGLVRADGSAGTLLAPDLQVSVAGVAQTVVAASPAAGEVAADPAIGSLVFGAALPATGAVVANYFIGQWDRVTTPIAGLLRVDVRALLAADALSLSAAVLDAIAGDGARLPGLRKIAATRIESLGAADPAQAGSRGRALLFAFEYDHESDRPSSSGGVIRRVPITTRLQTFTVDRGSGAIAVGVETESDPL